MTRDAVQIAGAVRAGRLGAAEVTEAALAAAEAGAALNAFTLVDAEGAGAAAARIDALVASGSDPGPLAGVPVVIKDLIDQRGRPTTCGSSFYRDIPEHSATVVDRLEQAGAVIIGRSGLHEFAYGFSSENPWFGPVRNPLDTDTSPGGSSGGSAAVVAAGIVPIGIGTDTGGSVRVPAALCGCIGLKVTHGRIPLSGVFPLAPSVDTVGPMTRTVADASLAYRVLAGYDPRDPWSRDEPVEIPGGAADPASLTFGVPHPWIDRPLESDVAAGWEAALGALASTGARIEHVEAADFVPEALPGAVWAEAAAVHRRWFEDHPERYGPDIRERLEPAMRAGVDEFVEALRWRADLRRAASHLFRSVDFLITPTTATRRKTIGDDLVDAGAEPEHYRRALSWFTSLVNQVGAPALSMPVGGSGSPPPSLQIVAPWWQESRLLEIGSTMETLFSAI